MSTVCPSQASLSQAKREADGKAGSARYLVHAAFLIGLFADPEDGAMFPWNVACQQTTRRYFPEHRTVHSLRYYPRFTNGKLMGLYHVFIALSLMPWRETGSQSARHEIPWLLHKSNVHYNVQRANSLSDESSPNLLILFLHDDR
jgi:hypothetical protein